MVQSKPLRFSWRYQIKEFSKDYWTVAVDMRGYADSEKPAKISDYFIDNMVEDINCLVNHLGNFSLSILISLRGVLKIRYF
jgi:pimeloyl-ACP methyl ester carboxylesterase